MAGSTSGNISDIGVLMKLNVDQASISESMRELGNIQSKVQAFQSGRGNVGAAGGLETQKAEAIAKEAEFQRQFNDLLKEEENAKVAAQQRDDLIAMGREQHLAEQKRLMVENYRQQEAAGQAREKQFQKEFAELLAQETKEKQLAAERISAAESLARQKAAAVQEIIQSRNAELATARQLWEQEQKAAQTAQTIAKIRAQEETALSDRRLEAENTTARTIAAIRQQETRALRQRERDSIAMRVHGVDLVARLEETAHEKRMRQLLTEDGFVRGAAGRISGAQAAADARNEGLALAGRSGRLGTRLQEFGRGFEDFFVGFSMAKTNIDGIAMGLRGSANNAAQMAASFNPMVGAAVAIGASLATIIVPATLRWLTATQELTKEQEKMIDGQIRMQKELAKLALAKDPREQLANDQREQNEARDQRRRLAEMIAKEGPTETTTFEQMFGAKNVKDGPRRQALLKAATELDQEISDRQNKMEQARRETQKKVWGADRKDASDAFLKEKAKNWKQDMESAKKAAAANASLQQNLDADSAKASKSKIDDATLLYKKRQKEIDDSEQKRAVKDKQTAQNLATYNAKVSEEQDRIALDKKIMANTEAQDALQERMSKSGNAAGPAAALISGTQAAESMINRALSGTRSVEDINKSQLKVLQDIHKALQKEKQQKTVSL